MPVRTFFAKYSRYFLVFTSLLAVGLFALYYMHLTQSRSQTFALTTTLSKSQQQLTSKEKELQALKNQDQYKRNEALQKEIKAIQTTYGQTVTAYNTIQDLQAQKQPTQDYEKQLAQALQYLSLKNYASAGAVLTALTSSMQKNQQKLAQASAASSTSQETTATAPVSNSAPGSGYSRQTVHTDSGDFVVDIIAADLGSTRVIVDTASDSDCSDNCPVLSLGDYVSRNGAYAGINGSYFCPTAYPQCAGKTNTFDLLVMNKNKHYFNSDNNVYSTNPAVIFSNGSVRFVAHASEWGRDTSPDGVLSNYPLLVSGGSVVYSDNPDPKFNSKGPRGFVANNGNTVYIGFVNNATMGESAKVLKTLGMQNAMNMDEGGSTALWYGGYKKGPGRNIPNAILFVKK
jgi:hypothetical protein